MTRHELIQLFLKTLSIKEKTQKTKQTHLKIFSDFLENSYSLDPATWNFDSVKIITYHSREIKRPIDTPMVVKFLSEISLVKTPNVYNDIMTTLNQFFNFLIDQEVLVENPAFGLEKKREIQKDMSEYRLSQKEAELLLNAAVKHNEHKARNFCLVLMLLSTATRIGALTKLAEENLNLEYGLIYVKKGKNGGRLFHMTPGVEESLPMLLEDPLRQKALEGQKKRYVFYSDKGGPLTTDDANDLLKALAGKLNLDPKITTYWLRRSFGTFLYESGLTLRECQYIFHHDRIKNTEAYVTVKKQNDLRELVNNSSVVTMLEDLIRNEIRPVTG